MKDKKLIAGILLLGAGAIGAGMIATNKKKISDIVSGLFPDNKKDTHDTKTIIDSISEKYKEASQQIQKDIDSFSERLAKQAGTSKEKIEKVINYILTLYKENKLELDKNFHQLIDDLATTTKVQKDELKKEFINLFSNYDTCQKAFEGHIEQVSGELYKHLHIASSEELKNLEKRIKQLEESLNFK